LESINHLIKAAGLRVTPQRIAVMEALLKSNHPTADRLIELIRKTHPNIAIGTIYKVLETFVAKGLIKKLETRGDSMRYDAILDPHHHLYCEKTNRIEDFYDEDLSALLKGYLEKKKIENFKLSDFRIQLIGDFTD
jgi:Fur family peroxide stress response transcriptional regulator